MKCVKCILSWVYSLVSLIVCGLYTLLHRPIFVLGYCSLEEASAVQVTSVPYDLDIHLIGCIVVNCFMIAIDTNMYVCFLMFISKSNEIT